MLIVFLDDLYFEIEFLLSAIGLDLLDFLTNGLGEAFVFIVLLEVEVVVDEVVVVDGFDVFGEFSFCGV